MFRPAVLIILIAGLLSAATVAAESSDRAGFNHQSSALNWIESQYQAGGLTLDDKVRLQITAIKYPEDLPQQLSSLSLSVEASPIRCGSAVLSEIRLNWDVLSAETRQYFTTAFERHDTEFMLKSPSGFFWLHYDTAGTDSVPSADDDFSGVPDFVERCAAYCDTVLAAHIDLGYLVPPGDGVLGGDSLYDIYFEETGLYGYAVPEGLGPEPWNDYYSYLVLNNDFLDTTFYANNDPEGQQAGAAKATCAHEFHHGCQYAYDVSEPTWLKEQDATYFEDIVFDATDDNYQYLGTFFTEPEQSLMAGGSHAYSSFIWPTFLAEHFDTSLMVAMWEGARWADAFESLSDSISGRYGWTIDSAMAEFSVWNYCTSTRDDGLHYEEAAQYPAVAIGRTHVAYPVLLQTSPTNPTGYGSCYVEFYPGSSSGILEITFNGDDNRDWSAWVIKSSSENVHEFEKIVLTPGSMYGTIEIPLFENYLRVTLVAANLTEYSEGAFFSYSAGTRPPYDVASEMVTIDSAVYSGDTRDFEYRITNPSTVNDYYLATGWDAYLWIETDTFDVPLGAGLDTIITFAVHPPAGTPLGNLSSVTFKVWSQNDPAVVDSQSTGALTVLYRGDLDFDGRIVVSDLTYLVAFLFTGGPDPLPLEESGDFTCIDDINVSDLTALVDYLFLGGVPPPCNPY